jgi:hypothetical protein
MSMVKKRASSGIAFQAGHFHKLMNTTEISTPSISIAPVTAMP